MKKAFLAVTVALSMVGFSFAQDDEYEEEVVYEEVEEAPAKQEQVVYEEVVEEEPAAPAKAKKAKSSGGAFLGIGMGFTTDFNQINMKFKLNDNMMITAILGLTLHGETTVEAGGVEQKGGDDFTELAIGAGFDYFLPTPFMATSVGGEFIYDSHGEQADGSDASDILFNVMFGAHAELVKNFVLSGKAGLGIDYFSGTTAGGAGDISRLDFGFKAGVYATWFFL